MSLDGGNAAHGGSSHPLRGTPTKRSTGSAYRPHSIEFLVDHVGRHIVALKQVAVETAKIAIDPFAFLYLFDAIHRRSLAFIKELRLIFPFDLLHLAHQVIAQRRQVSGGTRGHTACYRPAINNDHRPPALAKLIGRRQAGNAAPHDDYVAPFVTLQRDGLRRHRNRHPKRFAGH